MSKFAVYYHTHWDREWYQPFRSYQVRLGDVGDEILERLERDELPCFMLDGQTIVLRDYLELRPENKERLAKLIQSGRLVIGPWLVMPDEFLVGGESLLRNLAFGIQEAKAWGCHNFTGYLPDTFGHSADIPTILKGFGIDSAILWRGITPQKSIFVWKSPSGDQIKALHLTDGYFQMSAVDWTLSLEKRIEGLNTLAQKLEMARPHPETPVLIPSGGDHLAATPPEARRLLQEIFPGLIETTPVHYMKDISLHDNVEVVSGELLDHQGAFLLPGVWSARLYLKQENRRLEHAIVRRLEPLLALVQAVTNGTARYPAAELKLAWETLILNHPHDSICGCSVDAVHRENEVRFEQVSQIVEVLEVRAVAELTRSFGDAATKGWVVNTADRPYTGVALLTIDGPASEVMPLGCVPCHFLNLEEADWQALKNIAAQELVTSNAFQLKNTVEILQDAYLHTGHRIPMSHLSRKRYHAWVWVEDVSAFGLKLLDSALMPALPANVAPVAVTEQSIENGLFKITITPPGEISIHELETGKAHQNIHFKLRQDLGDSYNTAPTGLGTQAVFQKSTIVCNGPLCSSLQLTYLFPATENSGEFEITLGIALEAGNGSVLFDTVLSNHPLDSHKVQVVFDTDSPVQQIQAESHFSCVQRDYDPDYNHEHHMPAAAWKELKSNTGPIQRYFSVNGHSWITEGLTEYEVYGSSMAITLLRAFTALSSNQTGVRGAQAGPIFETLEGTSQKRLLTARFAWLPTPLEPAALADAASLFYGTIQAYGPRPLLDETGPISEAQEKKPYLHGETFSLVHWEEKSIISTACHWLPGRGLILRLLNTASCPVTTKLFSQLPYQSIQRVDFLNEPMADPSAVVADTITLAPQELQTFLFSL